MRHCDQGRGGGGRSEKTPLCEFARAHGVLSPLRRKLERDTVIVRASTIRSKPQAYSASVALKLRPSPSALLVTIHAATPETQRVGESGHVRTRHIADRAAHPRHPETAENDAGEEGRKAKRDKNRREQRRRRIGRRHSFDQR